MWLTWFFWLSEWVWCGIWKFYVVSLPLPLITHCRYLLIVNWPYLFILPLLCVSNCHSSVDCLLLSMQAVICAVQLLPGDLLYTQPCNRLIWALFNHIDSSVCMAPPKRTECDFWLNAMICGRHSIKFYVCVTILVKISLMKKVCLLKSHNLFTFL
jgi:hypothetical protein